MAYRRVKEPKDVVVLFKTDLREGADIAAYEGIARRMHELADAMPGFRGLKTFTAADGEEVHIARFASEADVRAWKEQPEHVEAQRRGREEFYDRFWVQVCRVIREYEYYVEKRKEPRPPGKA